MTFSWRRPHSPSLSNLLPLFSLFPSVCSLLRKEKRQPTPDEQSLIDEVEKARDIIIQVDAFAALGQEANIKVYLHKSLYICNYIICRRGLGA